ncbi:CYTH domain-containing protein [Enterococcus raffinosus]|uniref:CYTH domain-containing protein n=1 Tax=Enterococcus raffinosus TaxID=71452 RepID=UPI001C461D69|nr:CYTH domain-containing protein [Enterococcus raffinosus]MDT2573076.1 CYTH domain-containing protein [Enterococcus raffinosus]QXJ60153.1 CYTH domain-containing protein [Enterococcus raffinosus]
MSKEIEIEFKSMLTPDEYIELLRYYNVTDEQFVMQTNLYFDTADFQLKHLGMGLRIRRFTSKAEATLKIPQEIGLLEVTDSLTVDAAAQAIENRAFASEAKEVLTQLNQLAIARSDLQLIGKLITKRAEFDIPEGKLALDESWYGDQHDFELELEVPDSTYNEGDFNQLLSRFHITYRKTQNKVARAVTEQQRREKEMEGLQ